MMAGSPRNNASWAEASQTVDGALIFQYCFNHLLVSRLRMPVLVPPGNPPQVLAAVENVLGTTDTLDCSMKQSSYV